MAECGCQCRADIKYRVILLGLSPCYMLLYPAELGVGGEEYKDPVWQESDPPIRIQRDQLV